MAYLQRLDGVGSSTMAKQLKTFTRAELAQTVGDYVYDITKFAKIHPGGMAVLKQVAGQDATEQFYALHNKEALEKYHNKLCVGVLVKEGGKTNKTDLKLPDRPA